MSLVAELEHHPQFVILAAALLGLVVGSFLNVVIHRLPRVMARAWREEMALELGDVEAADHYAGEHYGLALPRSHCPHCGHAISALENIPVLSYLWLRGRCRGCGTPITARYPMVEILTGVLSAAVVWRFGFGLAGGAALVLTWALIALSFIDLDVQLLPDAITLPFLWLGLGLNLYHVFVPLDEAVIGAIAGYGILWCVYQGFRLLTGKEGMGYGDFKLLGLLGAWLGWAALPVVILLSSAVGAVVGTAMIALRGHGRDVPIPFGPYLAAAGWIALMWGEDLTRAYLQWSGA